MKSRVRAKVGLSSIVGNTDFSGVSAVLRPLYVSSTIDSLAYGMALAVASYFVVNPNDNSKHGGLGLTAIQVGLAHAAHALSELIGSFVVNRISDGTGRKPMVVFVFAWTGLGLSLIAVLGYFRLYFVEKPEFPQEAGNAPNTLAPNGSSAPTSSMSLASLFVLQQFIAGLNGGTSAPPQTFIIDVCSFAERGTHLARLGAIYGGTFAAGALVAGLLSSEFSAPELLLSCAALCLAAAAYAYIFLGESLPVTKRRSPDLGLHFTAELKESNKGACFIWVAKIGLTFATAGFYLVYPYYVRDYMIPANYPSSDYSAEEKTQAGNLYLAIFMALGAVAQMISLLLIYPRMSAALGKHMTIVFTSGLVAVIFLLLAIFGFDVNAQFSLAQSFPHTIWKFLLHASIGMAEASLPDALPLYVPDNFMGFSLGVLIGSRSVGAMISCILVAIIYQIDPPLAVASLAGAALGITGFFALLAKLFCRQERKKILEEKNSEQEALTGVVSDSARL